MTYGIIAALCSLAALATCSWATVQACRDRHAQARTFALLSAVWLLACGVTVYAWQARTWPRPLYVAPVEVRTEPVTMDTTGTMDTMDTAGTTKAKQ